MTTQRYLLGTVFAAIATAGCSDGNALSMETLTLPDGFRVEVYADDVPEARSLALGDEGTVFVSTRKRGALYALRDTDGDQRADKTYILAKELNTPNGIAFHDGDLYVATRQEILRYPNIESSLRKPPKPDVVADGFPPDSHHGWRDLGVGPDKKLYVSIGAPCNICDREGFANIVRLNLDGSGREVYAHGIRNSVGLTWHPRTGDLWFTDNGRDMLGDDLPPDELNRAPEAGMHFGYPYCHGVDIEEPELQGGEDCSHYTPPAQPLGPHVAALGLTFYTGAMFPAEYQGDIFIAEHGSWNRSSKIGYRISRVKLNERSEPISYQPFITGWLQGEQAWGRPVDVLQMPDGALLISDDYSDTIYRVSYRGDGK